jgi:NAD(P)H-dependent flavin oxidoreductase YrpB (nitropropane dioxygenase family)
MTTHLDTALTRLLGIRHPIIQTGMGWVAGPRLVAATSAAGGLGILGSATMTYDQLTATIQETTSRTDKPFGVNLRADAVDAGDRVELLILLRETLDPKSLRDNEVPR